MNNSCLYRRSATMIAIISWNFTFLNFSATRSFRMNHRNLGKVCPLTVLTALAATEAKLSFLPKICGTALNEYRHSEFVVLNMKLLFISPRDEALVLGCDYDAFHARLRKLFPHLLPHMDYGSIIIFIYFIKNF